MFCPKCGSQQPDGAAFCGSCGASLSAPAQTAPAQTSAPQAQGSAPASAPFTPAPGAVAGMAARPRTASHGLGMHTTVMVMGALLTIVLMFQAWFDFPVVSKIMDLAGSYASSYESIFSGMVTSAYNMPAMLGLANGIRGVIDMFTQQLSAYSSLSDLAEFQNFTGSFNLAATVITVLFALWVICILGILAGVACKMLTGNDFILFVAFAATAVVSLLCIIAGFIMNGAIEGALNDAMAMGGSSSLSMYASFKPIMAPAFGAYLTLIVSAASAVGTLLLKD